MKAINIYWTRCPESDDIHGLKYIIHSILCPTCDLHIEVYGHGGKL